MFKKDTNITMLSQFNTNLIFSLRFKALFIEYINKIIIIVLLNYYHVEIFVTASDKTLVNSKLGDSIVFL